MRSSNSDERPPTPGGHSAPTSRRRMFRAELLGRHTHETIDGQKVHVWIRDGMYLARGRHLGKAFGQTLGSDPHEASAAVRRLLVQLEDGTFHRPSEARKRPLKTGLVPRQNVRQLCDGFLADKRRLLVGVWRFSHSGPACPARIDQRVMAANSPDSR